MYITEVIQHENVDFTCIESSSNFISKDWWEKWAGMLADNSNFSEGDNFSVLFHKMLCQNDAMVSLIDGRGCAAEYFERLAQQASSVDKPQNVEKYKELAGLFSKIKTIICKMQEHIGGWDDTEGMLANLANVKIREKICEYIGQAKTLDAKALEVLQSL